MSKATLPAPLFALLILPFGAVTGYCGVTLPRVFELAGESTTAIAAFQALALQPHSFKFLIEPTLDARWRKRSWFLASIAIAAVFLPIAVMAHGHHARLTTLAIILFFANAAIATSSGAMHALMAISVPTEKKGAAAGWAMAGNLGGYGVGGAVGLFVTQKLPTPIAAASMTALIIAASLPALWIHEHAAVAHPIGETIKRVFRDAWTTLKSRQGWTGLVICLMPVGAGGAVGLFSAIATPYRAGDTQVALVNGIFGGIVSAVGCVVGGWAADRINRRLAYVLAGAGCAIVAFVMSLMPMTPSVYTVGCLSYQFVNGIAYAAWASFVLDLMGDDAAVATKHALYAAAANQATNYMMVVDGLAADRKVLGGALGGGPPAMLRMDALQTVIGLVVIASAVLLARKRATSDVALPSP
jgi:MFS transporter, PAT family, beta-lactamase induction signal transducer AmpG